MEGYKEKPLLIEIFSLIYLLNPIGNILLILFVNTSDTPLGNLNKLLLFISQGNIIVILNVIFWFSALPLAYGLYKVRLWAWYYFLIHSVGMVILSLFGNDYRIHFNASTIINCVFLIPIGYFISKEIRTPYFNPRVRWWEQAKRFQHEAKIIIEGNEYKTYDLSIAGAFVIDEGKAGLEIGELLPIILVIDNETINCFAEVRWVNNSSNRYPVGFGIKFDRLSIKDKAKLKAYIKLLQELGKKESR
ncbi:MAG TPA: PilZ domain-containing protein [Spirochaetota bacterium]|nr:PilZ domain-containing protein [Spirochaetota bacterium]HOL57181.1 PilZ domain-containing protein [Spirochaetota bacterium]HPP04795.1 PilZ domain-containing protein [Spirochaetota bacterium]